MSLSQAQRSRDGFTDRAPSIVDLGPIRRRRRGAYKVTPATRVRAEVAAASPTTPLWTVLKAFGITVALTIVFGAQGITETARGMSPGPDRAIVMTIGNLGIGVQSVAPPLTMPWEDFSGFIGHPVQTHPSKLDQPPAPVATVTPSHNHSVTTPPGPNHKRRRHHKHPVRRHHAAPWPKLPVISKSRSMELLVMGDSLPGYMGPQILTMAHAQGPVNGTTESLDGTGLWNPDFYDWDTGGPGFIRQFHADAVIMFMGGNDFENLTRGNVVYVAGTKAWTSEYERRAQIVMHDMIAAGAKRIYWLSMPPVDNSDFAPNTIHDLDYALQQAAAHTLGVRYVDISPAVTYHGKFAWYKKVNGVPTLIREPDGIHVDYEGSQLITNMVVPIIKKEWQFGWSEIKQRSHHHGGHHRSASPRRTRHSRTHTQTRSGPHKRR